MKSGNDGVELLASVSEHSITLRLLYSCLTDWVFLSIDWMGAFFSLMALGIIPKLSPQEI